MAAVSPSCLHKKFDVRQKWMKMKDAIDTVQLFANNQGFIAIVQLDEQETDCIIACHGIEKDLNNTLLKDVCKWTIKISSRPINKESNDQSSSYEFVVTEHNLLHNHPLSQEYREMQSTTPITNIKNSSLNQEQNKILDNNTLKDSCKERLRMDNSLEGEEVPCHDRQSINEREEISEEMYEQYVKFACKLARYEINVPEKEPKITNPPLKKLRINSLEAYRTDREC